MKQLKAKTQRNGFVIVIVLCMVIMLGALLVGFNYQSRSELREVDNLRKSAMALNCARAGLNIAILVIKDANEIYTNAKLKNLLTGQNSFTIGQGQCSVTITEENSKFNVNLLKDQNGRLNRTAIDQLLRLIDLLNQNNRGQLHIGYGIVPAIIDWTDNDDEVTYLPFIMNENTGVESGYYAQLSNPYRCTNRALDSIDELLSIKGITPEVFDQIHDYITVKGNGKININCASKLVIQSLSEKMDPALAQMLINQRKFKAFSSITELKDIPGMTDGIYNTIKKTVTVNPSDQYFHVTSEGILKGVTRTIVAILKNNTKTKNIDVILYKEV